MRRSRLLAARDAGSRQGSIPKAERTAAQGAGAAGCGLPPYEVITIVRSTGLDPLGPPMRRGPNYVLRATDEDDQEVRVVVDARSGDIVSRDADCDRVADAAAAWRRDDGSLRADGRRATSRPDIASPARHRRSRAAPVDPMSRCMKTMRRRPAGRRAGRAAARRRRPRAAAPGPPQRRRGARERICQDRRRASSPNRRRRRRAACHHRAEPIGRRPVAAAARAFPAARRPPPAAEAGESAAEACRPRRTEAGVPLQAASRSRRRNARPTTAPARRRLLLPPQDGAGLLRRPR